MPKISKRLASLAGKIEDRAYAPLEAIALVKDNANAKFDETMEAHVRLGIDPKYTDQQLRTTVALPNGTGQTVRIAVVTRGCLLYTSPSPRDLYQSRMPSSA